MKQVFVILIFLVVSNSSFAGHYHIEKINGGIEGYKSITEKVDTLNNMYTLVCKDPGFHYGTQKLDNSSMISYLSESGITYNMAQLIKSQETLLDNAYDDMAKTIKTRIDTDIIAIASFEGGKTIIDIYTAEDAKKKEHLLK